MKQEQIELLSRLPLLLNSSLQVTEVIKAALSSVSKMVNAEASAVFLKLQDSSELELWALQGGGADKLTGKKIPSSKGIVGWVIANNQAVLIPDAHKDPRFFANVDKESGFTTRDIICAPLSAHGDEVFGAIQILNKKQGVFERSELDFLEQVSHQLALAIKNAKLVEELQSRTKLLENLDYKKDEMISVIVHEFQTPLNLILTSADLIASGYIKEPETFKKVAGTLLNGASRLSRIISEIKNVSIVSGGKATAKISPFEIKNISEVLSSYFAQPIETRKLNYKIDILDNTLKATGDESLILIALRNLIANAIRFTPDGGSITLSIRPSTGMIEFAVSDTGIGIEKGQLDAIFEKFYEVTSALYHSSGQYEFKSCGLGLGLAAVKAIMQAHGATVKVDSMLKKGTTVKFSLPAA